MSTIITDMIKKVPEDDYLVHVKGCVSYVTQCVTKYPAKLFFYYK